MSLADAVPEARVLRGELSLTGYVLPEGLTYEEWASEGTTLITMARASMWWVGDWIRYGEHRWGDKYVQAIEATGFAIQTLKNAVWVCDRIPPAERTPGLEFGHHQAVAAIPEASRRRDVLAKAEAEGMTVRELRDEVRRMKADDEPQPAPDEDEAGDVLGLLEQAVATLDSAIEARDWHLVNRARLRARAALTLAREDAAVSV